MVHWYKVHKYLIHPFTANRKYIHAAMERAKGLDNFYFPFFVSLLIRNVLHVRRGADIYAIPFSNETKLIFRNSFDARTHSVCSFVRSNEFSENRENNNAMVPLCPRTHTIQMSRIPCVSNR